MNKLLLFFLMVPVCMLVLCGCGMGNVSYTGKQLVFETSDVDGNTVKSSELFAQHDITMLNLWATWCGPCVTELPYLNHVNDELAEMNGAVVGLINDGKGTSDVKLAKQYIDENKVSYLNIIAPGNFDELITQTAYPMTLFVNRDGVVIGKTLIGTTVPRAIVDYYVGAAREAVGEK